MERAITHEELDEMLVRYRIGKKPLAALLSWGETTIVLYTAGNELPDNEFTHRLYRLYNDVPSYLELLKKNGHKLTRVAYEKSLAAVYGLFPASKIMDCAAFVIQMTGNGPDDEMSLVRLEAILFWSQVISLVLYDTRMFPEDYQPSRAGFPYRGVEERMAKYGCIYPDSSLRVASAFEAESRGENISEATPEAALTVQDVSILEFVTNMFSWYGKNALDKLMNAERQRLCGPAGARKRRIASADILKRCYSEVFTQSKVKKLKDVSEYMNKRITFIRKTSE